MKIMVVEDNVEINKILTTQLIKDGYEVLSFNNAFDAIKGFQENNIFCVLTDLTMPILSGEEFINMIRKDYYGLIIAITSKTSMEDKLNVLSIGADDYITKPFNIQEVLLKVRNYLNKINRSTHSTILNNGDFVFNHHNNELKICNELVTLTSVEFLILKRFIDSLNKIVSRSDIMSAVYYDNLEVFDRAIDGHIKNIRKKIKKYSTHEYIKTVYGLGYKLCGESNV